MQSLQRGTARVQDVHRVRRQLCETLQGTDGRRSAEERRGELLRPLQTKGGCLRRKEYCRDRAVKIRIGRTVQKVTGSPFENAISLEGRYVKFL